MSDEFGKKAPHIEYRILAEKLYESDHAPGADCMDHIDAVVHGKADADRFVKFLQEDGYKVKMARMSKTYLVDERFSHECEPGAEPEKEEE